MKEEHPTDERESGSPDHPTRQMSAGRQVRLGLAIGVRSLTAVQLRETLVGPRPAAVYTHPLEPPAEDGTWPSLAAALRDLRATLRSRSVVLDIALLRPLCHVKVLALPPLGRAGLRQLVERNGERFFPTRGGPLLGDAIGVEGRGRKRKPTVFAAMAAEAALVTAVIDAAEEAGFAVDTIVPGPSAMAAGAGALAPKLLRGSTALALASPGVLEVLFLDGGKLRLARALPTGLKRDPETVPDVAELTRRVREVLREGAETHALHPGRLALAGKGMAEAFLPSADEDASQEPTLLRTPQLHSVSPEVLAALGAPLLPMSAPLLLPPERRARLQTRNRRRTAVLAAGAAGLVALAALLHLQDLRSRAQEVEQARTLLRPAVEQALQVRSDIAAVRGRVTSLRTLSAERPRWTALVTALADALPRDAYLTALQTRDGEIRLEGRARSAASVIPALEESPWFQTVRLVAPVQRDPAGGSFEQFTLAFTQQGETPQAGVEPEMPDSTIVLSEQDLWQASPAGAP